MDQGNSKPKPAKPPKPSLNRNDVSKGVLAPAIVISEPEIAPSNPTKRAPPKPKFNRESSSSSATPEPPSGFPSVPLPPVSRTTTPRPTASPLPSTPSSTPRLGLEGYRPPVPAPRSPMLLIEPQNYVEQSPSPDPEEKSPMLSTGVKAYEWAPIAETDHKNELEPPLEIPTPHLFSGNVPVPALPPRLNPTPPVQSAVTILERSKAVSMREKALKSSNISHEPPNSSQSLHSPDIKGVFPVNEQCNLVCTQTSITLVSHDQECIWTSQDYEVTCCVADSDRLWIGMPSGLVACLDLVQGHAIFLSRTAHTKPVFKIWYDQVHDATISLGSDGKALVWHDFDKAPTVFRTVPTQISGALYHSGKLYVTTKNSLYVYDPFGSTLYLTPRPIELPVDSTSSTRKHFNCIQTDGRALICGHNDGTVSTFDLNSFQLIFSSKTGIHAINCIAAVEGLWWLGLSSGSIMIIDPDESTILREWKAGPSPIKSLESVYFVDKLVVSVSASEALLWNPNIDDLPNSSSAKKSQHKNVTQSIRIFSWNVDSRNPDSMAPELIRNNCMDSDVLVFGLQEVVELSNKTKTAKNLASGGDQTEHKEYGLWKRYFNLCLGQNYNFVYDKALVGLYTIVFSKNDNLFVNECSLVKTGMGGLHGNKGGISLSLDLDGTDICLINCHLAAGHSQIIQRNRDAAQIIETPVGTTKPLDHEYCFFFGDTNYRINTARELAVKYIKDGEYTRLSQLDQLNGQKRKNPTFVLNAMEESDITFPPTYKFDRNSDKYDTSDKKRIPAWCDRILYRGPVSPVDYTSIKCQYSDHRPVTGKFNIQI